jgi:hypothetical protein
MYISLMVTLAVVQAEKSQQLPEDLTNDDAA